MSPFLQCVLELWAASRIESTMQRITGRNRRYCKARMRLIHQVKLTYYTSLSEGLLGQVRPKCYEGIGCQTNMLLCKVGSNCGGVGEGRAQRELMRV